MMNFRILRSKDEKVDRLLDENKGDVIDLGDQRVRSTFSKLMIFILGLLFVILVWYVIAWFYNTYMAVSISFPDPVSTFGRAYELFTTDFKVFGSSIIEHTKASILRWIIGFFMAFTIGISIGIVLGTNEKMYQFGSVPVNILQLIPGLAWLPVMILLFGFGEEAAIFIIAVTAISPIAINVANGLRRVPKVNLRLADMSGRTRLEKFSEVLLPFALLDILAGIRIGMANGWRMLIAAEMVVGVAVGLGFVMWTQTGYLDYATAFACIVIICVIAIVIDKLVLANIESYARRRLGMEEV
jgi:ABC-type nitrate/sulfonate/bicarbonate transport system permease component